MAIENEAQAEDVLLAAVMAPEQDLAANSGQDLDEPDQIDADDHAEEGEEGEKKVEAKEAEKQVEAKEEAPPEEDEVEVPGEDGQEPTRIKVSELLASHKEFQAFKGREAETIERVQREAVTAAQNEYRQVREFSLQTGAMIQAAMQLLQPPRQPVPPNPALMNQDYTRWEQENAAYQQAQYQYGLAMQQFNQAQGLGQQLLQRAQEAQARSEEERDTISMRQLERKGGWYADFAKDDPKNPNGVRAKFASEMGAAYGYSWDELDAQLTDPRNLEVAKDALAYRAMKAKGGEVKAKVEAKAPKLVRSKQEAKGGATRDRDGKGQFVSGSLANLKKTNSDADAAAYFTGLVRAGRI